MVKSVKAHLDSSHAFRKKQGTHGLRDGTGIWIDRTHDTDPGVAAQGRLKHPRELGVSIWNMFTRQHLSLIR